MREISSDYMDLLTSERDINTRFTFRDTRLVFETFASGEQNLPEMDNDYQWDACGFGPYGWTDKIGQSIGFARVARNTDGYLCYQVVRFPHITPWDDWVVTEHLLMDCKPTICHVGVDETTGAQASSIYALMDLGGDPQIVEFSLGLFGSLYGPMHVTTLKIADFTIGSPHGEEIAPPSTGVAFAGINHKSFFVQFFPYDTVRDINYAVIQHYKYDASVYKWTMSEFPGAVYGDIQHPYHFDAGELDGMRYVLTSDSAHGRPLVFKSYYKLVSGDQIDEWSSGRYVFPLDVLDDTSYLKFGGISWIDGKLWITGRLKRGSDIEMDVYMYGDGDNFSMGRDMYIANSDEIPASTPGIFFLVDGVVYYVGHGIYARADATYLVGIDSSDHKLVTSDINTFSLQVKAGSPWMLNVAPKSDLEHDAVRGNGEITVDAGLLDGGGVWQWAQLGVFGIDALSRDYFGAGNERMIMARGSGIKRLSQWTSDAFYDYWSQAKLVTDPAELSEVIRVSGQWETEEDMEEEPLRLDRLNEIGIMYTSAKASRNGQCSAKFYLPSVEEWEEQIMEGRFGVGINYYRESRGQAAERLEKELGDVTDSEFGNNGIFAIYDVSEGALILYVVSDSVWYELDRNTFAWPENEWDWIMIRFEEGWIRVEIGTIGSSPLPMLSWFPYLEQRFDTSIDGINIEPWFRDQRGRGAIVVENVSAHSITPGFASTSTIIPVESIDPFPSAGTVIVDSEIITHDGRKSIPASVNGLDMNRAEGLTYSKAEHDNDLWTDVKIHHIDYNPDASGEISIGQSHNYNLASMQAFKGPYGRERIDKVRVMLRTITDTGTDYPPMPIYMWIVNDSFDNGGMPTGIKDGRPVIPMASAPVAGNLVSESYNWVEFDFTDSYEPLRWLDLEYEKGYFIFLTTIPPIPLADPTHGYTFGKYFWTYDDPDNFYVVRLDNTVSSTTGVWLGWSANDSFKTFNHYVPGSETMMPFEMYGVGNIPSSGYEIYIDGYLPEMGRAALDDAALVVTDGPGKGMAFQVTGYDWRAPKQWVTSRTYLAPDTMEDHINDPAHGDWVDHVLSRIFVSSRQYGALGEGSVLQFYPSLIIDERGTDDTVATAHPSGNVSLYSPASVLIDEVRYFSGEVDMRLEDMARELCAKAGILDFAAEQDYDEVFTPSDSTSGSYNVVWMPGERRHGIVEIDAVAINFPSEYGIIFRADALRKPKQYYVLEIHNNLSYLNLRLGIKRPDEQDIFWLEETPILADMPESTWTFSFQEESFSVWLNDRHVHTFVDTELDTGEFCGFFTAGMAEELTVRWSALDIRVDNFVLDLGYRGAQLLSSLIGPKKALFQDTQTGGIYLERISLPGPPEYTLADLTTEAAKVFVDSKLINRTRAEGAEIAEVVNWKSIREDGNLFFLVNATEANDEWETAREAEFILSDSHSSSKVHTIRSAADPRVEANDIVRARSTDGYLDLMVQSVSMSMKIDSGAVEFDMIVEGYDTQTEGLYTRNLKYIPWDDRIVVL